MPELADLVDVRPGANVELARLSRGARLASGYRWKILLDGRYIAGVSTKAEARDVVRSLNLWRAGRLEDVEFTRCWCGSWGWPEDLFQDDGLEESCGGSGEINCFCGGDFCVCHNHGASPCLGCRDCEDLDRDAGGLDPGPEDHDAPDDPYDEFDGDPDLGSELDVDSERAR